MRDRSIHITTNVNWRKGPANRQILYVPDPMRWSLPLEWSIPPHPGGFPKMMTGTIATDINKDVLAVPEKPRYMENVFRWDAYRLGP